MNANDIPFEPFIAAPISLIIANLDNLEPAKCEDSALVARQQKLLDIASSLTSTQEIEPLRIAIISGDLRATAALGQIDETLRSAFSLLLERCKAESDKRLWSLLLHDAYLAIGVAEACGMRAELARAWLLRAFALSGLNDDRGAIEALESAVEASDTHSDKLFLSSVHERLGDALAATFQLDEALQHYETAGPMQVDEKERQRITLKAAGVLTQLGEFKSAAQKLQSQITQMKSAGVSGIELAINLDMAAQAVVGTGEFTIAAGMLQEARALFPAAASRDRVINSLIHARVLRDSGDNPAAAQAFEDAHEMALTIVRTEVDPEHYRNGFHAALETSLPANDEAVQLFREGILAQIQQQYEIAFQKWQLAANRAYAQKDVQLRLRVKANVAALYSDLGIVDSALEIGMQLSKEARERGLARPEYMALTTLESVISSGADIDIPLGPLGLLTRAAALQEMHSNMLKELNLTPAVLLFEFKDTGQIDNELALLSLENCSDRLAARYFRSAIAKAQSPGNETPLINRLCGLCGVLARQGDSAGANATAVEIDALIKSGKVSVRGLLAGHRALGVRDAEANRLSAISHLGEACELMKAFRRTIPLGLNRADYDREFHDIPDRLAELLYQDNHIEDAFDTLQLGKGRRVIDALAAKEASPDENRDASLTAEEARSLLARAGAKTVLVDLAVQKDGVTAYVVDAAQVRALQVSGDMLALDKAEQGDVEEREARVVSLCLNSTLLQKLAQAVADAVPSGCSLMIVADKFLHNLPFHAIPVHGRPWVEQTPMTYAPTAAILRFTRSSAVSQHALIAGDSRGDLKGAAEECVMVGATLDSTPLIGPSCTRVAVEKILREDQPDIVHLAVHGQGDARLGGRSSILFADGKGGVEWVDFEELTRLPWSARLVVFSGCSTGLLGLRHGTQLLSVANAALEAGAATVIASLWPVDDEYAKSFMGVFYGALAKARRSGRVDLRLLIEEARRSVQKDVHSATQSGRRDGRHFGMPPGGQSRTVREPKVAEALAWAPFCIFGAPMFDG